MTGTLEQDTVTIAFANVDRPRFADGVLLPNPFPVAARVHEHLRRSSNAAETWGRSRLWVGRLKLKAPFRSARVALGHLAKHGAEMEAEAGYSRLRQFVWAWWMHVRHNYSPDATYRFQLFNRQRTHPVPLYLSWEGAAILCRTVLPKVDPAGARVLADKREFARWAAANDIPSPRVLLEFADGSVTQRSTNSDKELCVDLFAKWATQLGGSDTSCWTFENGTYMDAEGRRWSLEEIVAQLSQQSLKGPVLLQPRLFNHPGFEGLTRNALNTIRVMTTRRPGERPRLLAAVLRISTGNAIVDNITQGGIASVIDAPTGTLGTGCSADAGYFTRWYPVHPDTKVPIKGRAVPMWEEVVRVAVRAHELLGPTPCVGWDIAVTPEGPVVVEGNWNPGTRLMQKITHVPLLSTEYAGAYAAWLETPQCRFNDETLSNYRKWSPL